MPIPSCQIPMLNRVHRNMRDHTLLERAERGQALVILAAAFIGLAVFTGLTVDAGILFSNVGHLRRATDAAALAAANQFREGWNPEQIEREALEMLKLNGLDDLDPLNTKVELCDLTGLYPDNHDADLCPDPGDSPSKKVRVDARMKVNFAFLPIIGFHSTFIRADAESEAASIDMVLALDVSDSMSLDLCYDENDDGSPRDNDGDGIGNECSEISPGEPGMDGTFDDDVALCRDVAIPAWPSAPPYPTDARSWAPANACWPFEDVRFAAHKLVDRMYFPYDRLSIVTFGRLPSVRLELDDTDPVTAPYSLPAVCFDPDPKACAHKVLDGLKVEISPQDIPGYCDVTEGGDTPKGCMSTNIGDGLLQAGARFCVDDNPKNGDCDRATEMREEAVWITILLTDGAANAAIGDGDPANFNDWICPESTYWPASMEAPWCRDDDADTRHPPGTDYDADDYARDQADIVGCPGPGNDPPPGCPDDGGVGSVIFSIGLGKNVTENPEDENNPRAGEFLLRYIAAVGIDADPTTDPFCSPAPPPDKGVSCGNYYFSPDGPGLVDVFEDIASRIFTRITH